MKKELEQLIIDLRKQVDKGRTGDVALNFDSLEDHMVGEICEWVGLVAGPIGYNQMEDDLYEAGVELTRIVHKIWGVDNSRKIYDRIRWIIPRATYDSVENKGEDW